jgi:hypothetical protein
MNQEQHDNGDSEVNPNTSYDEATYSDQPLPLGWRMVIHRSGMACFFHDQSGVVVWSKPYTISGADIGDAVESIVQKHPPPLEIFAEGSMVFGAPDRNQPCAKIEADGMLI